MLSPTENMETEDVQNNYHTATDATKLDGIKSCLTVLKYTLAVTRNVSYEITSAFTGATRIEF